jgi:hypothetical protein
MNQLNLQFLQQPSNADSFTYTLEFVPPLTQTYTGIYVTGIPFAGQIQIGATLLETIQNTQAYLQLNFPLPGLNYTIIANNLIITKATRDFELGLFLGIEDTLVIGDEIPIVPKIKINIRSPYKILIDEDDQDGSKIELFFWNKGDIKPTIAQHILSKKKVSNFQTANEYNISEFAKEYINPIAPIGVTAPEEEDVNTWCYMEVKRYKLVGTTYSEIDTLEFICLNGFNSYQDGLNKSTIAQQVVLTDNSFKRLQTENNSHYVNVWLEDEDYTFNNDDFTVTTEGIWRLPLKSGSNSLSIQEGAEIFNINIENQCEPIYTPLKLSFINRFGGWDFITLFKNSVNSFSATAEDYSLLPSQSDYDIRQGQKRRFNHSLMQKVKCNTGFVPQGYSEMIKDLLVSDVMLLNEKPVYLVATSFEEKTTLNNNNINYELEFEYNYNLINGVI